MENPYAAPPPTQQYVAPPETRPVTATVFGILNLVLGIVGFCGGVFGGGFLMLIASGVLGDEFIDAGNLQNPIYQAWMVFSMVVSLFLQVLLIAAGVGLLQFKPWGRTFSNYYAIPSIVLVLASLGVELGFNLLPALQKINDVAGPERAGLIGGAVGGMLGGCFGMLYPVVLLFFMNRNPFKDQIQRA